jgi:soluble lytic murein transglycosylase-like protein
MRSPYRAVIERAAADHDLDPLLVEAVVWQESSGMADAFRYEPGYWERYCKNDPRWTGWEPRRVASSYGLMQLMYPTALDTGYVGEPEGLFDINTNVQLGCRLLAKLLAHWNGDVLKALASYNGGLGGVNRSQPMHYAHQVATRYERYRALATPSPDGSDRRA